MMMEIITFFSALLNSCLFFTAIMQNNEQAKRNDKRMKMS